MLAEHNKRRRLAKKAALSGKKDGAKHTRVVKTSTGSFDAELNKEKNKVDVSIDSGTLDGMMPAKEMDFHVPFVPAAEEDFIDHDDDFIQSDKIEYFTLKELGSPDNIGNSHEMDAEMWLDISGIAGESMCMDSSMLPYENDSVDLSLHIKVRIQMYFLCYRLNLVF